jgi:predicted glycoside hydrolase/deacetylase ChbG (UPF0249 family)
MTMSRAHRRETNRRLGYTGDARLLFVNADDFGMYAAINEAIIRAFKEGIVRSTTLMVPSPGAPEAIQLIRENQDIHFGVHLSIVRDYEHDLWGPLAPWEKVSSLLDENGNFYVHARQAELFEQARRNEVEIEFRTQVEAVLATGCHRPTHLDWHSLLNGGRTDIFDLMLGLAKEYGLALRVMTQPLIDRVQQLGLPTVDYAVVDTYGWSVDDKAARYARALRELPVGLTEWAVHPSVASAESRAIDPVGWPVRRADFDFLVSPQAREIVREEGIILINYAPIQKRWQAGSS